MTFADGNQLMAYAVTDRTIIHLNDYAEAGPSETLVASLLTRVIAELVG